MAESSTSYSGGIGLPGLLFLVFLVLKLCGVIDWSWWWVTCPLWIPIVFVMLVCLLGWAILGTDGLLDAIAGD